MINLNSIAAIEEILKKRSIYSVIEDEVSEGQLYCPSCGDYRRMLARPIYSYGTSVNNNHLFEYRCVQCKTIFMALVYQSADGPALAIFSSTKGGLTTPNTPAGVAYYLDQAHKAQSTGANSAAMAMYRGALEHLLYEQGYTQGMLGTKLNKLDSDIKSGSAPKWALELETDFLDVMKELGNGAIHPNDGDITKQSALDSDLIEAVKATFHQLLFLVYELPHQKQQQLNLLRSRANILKK